MSTGGGTPLLAVQDLVVRFGGLRALDGASISIPDSGVVGLIGPNGAGKTTFIDAVTGFVPVASGSVQFAGDEITNRSAHRRAQLGLSRTFQSLELFEDLTVEENVVLPTETATWWRNVAGTFRWSRQHDRPDVAWAMDQLDLHDVVGASPAQLSQAQRKSLALARAIAARPRLLLLDEPAAGLDEAGTQELGERLRQLGRAEMTLLLVDHDMALVLDVCDHIYVLDAGQVIAAGDAREIRTNPDVLRAYLGEDVPTGDSAPESATS